MIEHVKIGDKFLCIKDVYMINENDVEDDEPAYIQGEVYVSEYDGNITDEQGDKIHGWPLDGEINEYFVPYIEKKEEKAYATFDEEPMVKDAAVPFDLAKDLKYVCHLSNRNCECMGTYDTNGRLYGDYTTEQFPCPTIYNANSFLRVNYGIEVIVIPIDTTTTAYMGGEKYYFKVYHGGKVISLDVEKPGARTYEEAMENGLRYTIRKHIEKK